MHFSITPVILGTRPPVTKPNPLFLKSIGEARMRKLISDHYEGIKRSDIFFMFPQSDEAIEQAKVNASDFFIQICGGPAYFNQNRGAPMMAKRHAPFPITQNARITWLTLYMPLLNELIGEGVDEALVQSFWEYLDIFSAWMMNTKG